jgi:hypothetical protein
MGYENVYPSQKFIWYYLSSFWTCKPIYMGALQTSLKYKQLLKNKCHLGQANHKVSRPLGELSRFWKKETR